MARAVRPGLLRLSPFRARRCCSPYSTRALWRRMCGRYIRLFGVLSPLKPLGCFAAARRHGSQNGRGAFPTHATQPESRNYRSTGKPDAHYEKTPNTRDLRFGGLRTEPRIQGPPSAPVVASPRWMPAAPVRRPCAGHAGGGMGGHGGDGAVFAARLPASEARVLDRFPRRPGDLAPSRSSFDSYGTLNAFHGRSRASRAEFRAPTGPPLDSPKHVSPRLL